MIRPLIDVYRKAPEPLTLHKGSFLHWQGEGVYILHQYRLKNDVWVTLVNLANGGCASSPIMRTSECRDLTESEAERLVPRPMKDWALVTWDEAVELCTD